MSGNGVDAYRDRAGVVGVARRNVADHHPSVAVIIRTGVSKLVSPHVNDGRITKAGVIRVRIINEPWIAIKVGNDTFGDGSIVASVDAR